MTQAHTCPPHELVVDEPENLARSNNPIPTPKPPRDSIATPRQEQPHHIHVMKE